MHRRRCGGLIVLETYLDGAMNEGLPEVGRMGAFGKGLVLNRTQGGTHCDGENGSSSSCTTHSSSWTACSKHS
jgi:hypothetical protein